MTDIAVGDWVEYKSHGGATFLAEVTEIQGSWVYLGKEHGMLCRSCSIADIIETRKGAGDNG